MTLNILDVITSFERTADQFLSKEEFKRRLRSRRQQRVKYTIDVKTDNLHIGHAVNLWLVRRLQDLGHKAVIIFTDSTSHIGDKDGKLETIMSYPEKTLDRKIRILTKQACMILRDDPNLLEIRRNSEWYADMSVQELMKIFSLITHAKLVSRDTFQMYIEEGRELYISEMLYPILQGYDSYKIMSDIAVVGTDQLFNESLGRLIQEKHKKKPQTLITTRMTPGIDGKVKQSQRRDNDISLAHTPRDKFGRIMSIPDELLEDYFRMYTDIPYVDLVAIHALIAADPREAKVRLAESIVARYHGEPVARKERDWFEDTISRGYTPEDLPTLTISHDSLQTLDLVVIAQPEKSRGEARRLIAQGAVELNGRKLKKADQELRLKSNDVLQVGKRQWFRLEIAKIGAFESGKLLMRPCHVHDIPQILAAVPEEELARYLLRHEDSKDKKEDKKEGKREREGKGKTADSLRKVLIDPRKNEQAVFAVFSKDDPAKMVGISHFAWMGGGGVQNFWLNAELANNAQAQDILRSLGRHAFYELHLEVGIAKTAFAMANVGEALYEAQRQMDAYILSREDAYGVAGFTHEGWDKYQQWKRFVSPWLYSNEAETGGHAKEWHKTKKALKPWNPESGKK